MKLGLNQHEASDILAQHLADKVSEALNVVEARLLLKTGAPIGSKPAYFRWALNNDIKAPAPKVAGKQKQDPAPAVPTLLERFHAERAKTALDVFREMDEQQRAEVYAQFQVQSTLKPVAIGNVLDSGVTRTSLGLWYAQALWGEPGVEELSNFAGQDRS